MTDVAKFCNRYPNIEMNHEVEDAESAATGSPTMVHISLEREAEVVSNVIGGFKIKKKPYSRPHVYYCIL